MIINAPIKKTQELISLLCQELAGDDNELIESIKPLITPIANTPELNEEGVDNLLQIIRERRMKRSH